LVHVTGDIHYAVLGIWGRPVILTIHDLRFLDESNGLRKLLFWFWWVYLPCLNAQRITVISHATKERLLHYRGIGLAKIRVIPNCVNPSFGPVPRDWQVGRLTFLLVGTTPNKNLERIVDACAGMDVTLMILGRLSGQQNALLVESGTRWENYVDLPENMVLQLYAKTDLVLFVPTYEGFGLPILEAQAVGRPLLTSNILPMTDVAGEGALKVDPFDVAAIRSGIMRLLEDAPLRNDLIEKGFQNVKQYSAHGVAEQYGAVYREVLELE
jgi:glycosyltransferase involved in cell wall biosynthesis